ncbi:MAG: hypothetical protein E5W38_15820 [Mesorhizobium sp.]|uniref:hypothetical protein n=1 Tax=Mesorhizobium sp. TaxID=1871066 RepID=UPI000FE9D7F4|nr:hypothetical protein [Mesorhizobium sp.]RWB53033.1 MAG: hypothetical protein EOQ47_23365 [Mesorhizobium sp.]TIU31483.1 MAG: hypothetical protein E5W38_15820 [Mesorhizobium sp.]TKB18584.1 MAG: hypothetical protein E5V75_09820 [Mesorhizobium sp.]
MGFLDDAIRFQQHVQKITSEHFELMPDFAYFSEFHERDIGGYLRYLSDQSSNKPLTSGQTFLSSLSCLLGPALESIGYRNKISRTRPKIGSFHASQSLIGPVKNLSFEAYHFAECLKFFLDSARSVAVNTPTSESISVTIGKIIKNFKNKNKEWIAYRNFIVHGPINRNDPFRYLVIFELGAITLHNDLWLEFRNVFDEERDVWRGRAKNLLKDMIDCLSVIQGMNESLLAANRYTFAPTAKASQVSDLTVNVQRI